MHSLSSIAAEKFERLNSVPNTFLAQIPTAERQIFAGLVARLGKLTRDKAGNILPTAANLKQSETITTLMREVFDDSSYIDAVAQFAGEYQGQMNINTSYFRKAFPSFSNPSAWAVNSVGVARNSTVNALINTSADLDFIAPVAQAVEAAVLSGSSFTQTIDFINQLTVSSPRVESKLLRYSKQIAHDAFAITDRTFTNQMAVDNKVEWFRYSGSDISTTRPFCRVRSPHYYPKKEVQSWAVENWAGKFAGTDSSNIFNYAGGYNCRHSILPVSVSSVPKARVERAIREGFYSPDKATLEKLGIGSTIAKPATDLLGSSAATEASNLLNLTYGLKGHKRPKNLSIEAKAALPDQLFGLSDNGVMTKTKLNAWYGHDGKARIPSLGSRYRDSPQYQKTIYAHEYGHRIHENLKLIYTELDTQARKWVSKKSPATAKAYNESVTLTQKMLGEAFIEQLGAQKKLNNMQALKAKWLKKLDDGDLDAKYNKKDVFEMVSGYTDTLEDLTNGRQGWGHGTAYFRKHGKIMEGKEWFAHMSENFWFANPIFEAEAPELYKQMMEFYKKEVINKNLKSALK